MDKWRSSRPRRSSQATSDIFEDSLLPPTLRATTQQQQQQTLDSGKPKKWSIDGIFKKRLSAKLQPGGSTSSSDETITETRRRRRCRGNKSNNSAAGTTGYAATPNIDGDAVLHRTIDTGIISSSNNNNNNNNNEEEEENNEESYDNSSATLANNYLNATAASPVVSHQRTLDIMEQIRLAASSNQSRSCSDNGSSLDFNNPNRRVRKDKVKARVEAKRDQLCHGDSSVEESCSNNEDQVSRSGSGKLMFSSESGSGNNSNGKRRSRASRTERYMKRMCNGTTANNGTNGVANGRSGFVNIAHYHSDLKDRDRCKVADEDRYIRPIERVPRSVEYGALVQQSGVGNGEMYTRPYLDNDVPTANDNFYTRQADVGVNPLVQQTLQYFSEFDRNMALQQQHKLPVTRNNRVYPNHHRHSHHQSQYQNNHHNHHHHHHQRRNSNHQNSNDDIIVQQQQQHQPNPKFKQPLLQLEIDEERLSSVTPPKPPCRDHRSRILTNGTSLHKYQQMLSHMQRSQPDCTNKENQNTGYYASVNPRPNSPTAEVRSINGNEELETNSPDSMRSTMMMAGTMCNDDCLPQNRSFSNSQIEHGAIRSPLRESLNTSVIRGGSSKSSPATNPSPHHSPDTYKSKIIDSPSPQRLNPTVNSLKHANYENCAPHDNDGVKSVDATTPAIDRMSERRSSKNLEEALCELEAIYNSLQLGDEELLDRAEKRTMEEFLYKGFTASPDCLDGCSDSMAMRRKTWADSALASNREEPDRLRDDMAYRRIHAKNRPSSVDGQSSVSSISYLMTSPIPSTRDADYVDPRRKPRRREPDVTLDDVVYRSVQYANNTLKVVEPQPPFGIPLGPITTATESDYLHTDPSMSERARSPYIPNKEPDIVTDDLAYRNLRKDAQPSSISSRQASPSFHTPMSNTPSPLPFNLKKKQQRAAKSLSANLYGMINRSPRSPMQDLDNDDMFSITTDSTLDDYFNEAPSTRMNGNRRISDPEVPLSENWQKSSWQRLDVNSNRSKDRIRVTDLDLNGSGDESYDETRSPRTEVLRITDVDLEHKAASEKGIGGISSGVSSSYGDRTPPRNVDPVSEQDLSVYKKLCQDLENLVQMTKGIDDSPIKSEPVVVKSHSPVVKETKSITKPILLQDTSSAAVTFAPSSNSINVTRNSGSKVAKSTSSISSEVTSEEQKPKKDERKTTMDIGTSTINREISNLLDSLKCLDEESSLTLSSCLEKKDEVSEDVVDAAFVEGKAKKEVKKVTKETKCDLASSSAADKSETLPIEEKERSEKFKQRGEKKVYSGKSKEEDEEEERIDKVDENIFFRNAQLAKLSGDWKESTPKSAVINRRTSLITSTSSDNNNVGSSSGGQQQPWEGMNKCNHKYHSMPAKTSSLTLFRQYGSKKKSNRKSLCTIS